MSIMCIDLKIKLHKPTVASCVFTILLVAQLRGFGLTQHACAHDMSNRLIGPSLWTAVSPSVRSTLFYLLPSLSQNVILLEGLAHW